MSITNYIVNHIPKTTPYKRRPGIALTPQYITIHSTANLTSTAKNERDWLVNKNNTVTASWHIAVDENQAVEAIPLNEVAYHAGTKAGNNSSIGIEICESGDRQKTLQNAAQLVAKLLKERGWGVDKLRRHYDWSGKICPRIFYNNGKWTGWDEFKKAVQNELVGGGNMPNTQNNQPSSWAKEAWEWAKQQGLLDGTRPKDNLTRQELAVVLKRLAEKK